jgi:ATP-dependent exoDNAse (exonuclease V) alpha subunit
MVKSLCKLKSKVIFVGDPAQLPPVNEDNSSVFIENFDKIIMSNIVRNNDTHIVGLCNEVRKWIDGEEKPILKKYKSDNVCTYKNKKENKIESKWFKKFMTCIKNKSDNELFDLNKCGSTMILSWTNKQINEYNQKARNLLFEKEDLEKYEIGDFLIFNEFYNAEDGTKFHTSEQVIINKIKLSEKKLSPLKYNSKDKKIIDLIKSLNSKTKRTYNIYEIGVKKINSNDDVITINVIDEKSLEDLEKDKDISMKIIGDLKLIIEEEEIKKIWSYWNNIFVDYFAQVNYGYAITVHKAQGSGFSNVFVDLPDIIKNRNVNDTKRCIYTAFTRSEKTLHILF